jgi:hypothetical protein
MLLSARRKRNDGADDIKGARAPVNEALSYAARAQLDNRVETGFDLNQHKKPHQVAATGSLIQKNKCF